jgi:hypothetical protein
MIFALLDEPTLLVLNDIVEARRELEPYDAASGDVRFFDEHGRALMPVFPHRSDRRILGILVDDDPGPYELLPAPTESTPTLAAALGPHIGVAPNPWFASIDDVRRHLAQSRGAGSSASGSPAS